MCFVGVCSEFVLQCYRKTLCSDSGQMFIIHFWFCFSCYHKKRDFSAFDSVFFFLCSFFLGKFFLKFFFLRVWGMGDGVCAVCVCLNACECQWMWIFCKFPWIHQFSLLCFLFILLLLFLLLLVNALLNL